MEIFYLVVVMTNWPEHDQSNLGITFYTAAMCILVMSDIKFSLNKNCHNIELHVMKHSNHVDVDIVIYVRKALMA